MWLLIALAALLLCPGYLLERALLRQAGVPAMARPALWVSLSISAVALLYQWATAAGLALAPWALAALAGACALGSAWRIWAHPGGRAIGGGLGERARRAAGGLWWGVLLAVLALTLWTRLAHIRNLAAPAWVDALHHALLIRVAVERGQAPYVLDPYLPIAGLTYHSGFHTFVAAALNVCAVGQRLAGAGVAEGGCDAPLQLPGALLLIGQVLNALVGLAWAGAAAFLWRRRSAAAAAALVVGLASIMPAYYVSWGRYTLVAGMLMLPGAMIAAHEALVRGGRAIGAAALLLAGLSLVHFVVLCLTILWCVAALVAWRSGAGAPAEAMTGSSLRRAAARGAILGALTLALTAPWSSMLVA